MTVLPTRAPWPQVGNGAANEPKGIQAMNDNTLDQTETKAVLTDEVSDDALEAAAGTDRGQRADTLGIPIWCCATAISPKSA
jgi:hypothetical protein